MLSNRKKRLRGGWRAGVQRAQGEPTSRGRFLLRTIATADKSKARLPVQLEGGRTRAGRPRHYRRGRRGLYTFLRNEPILFLRYSRRIARLYRHLCRLQRCLQMGSFWKNEPISGGLCVGFIENWVRFEGNQGRGKGRRRTTETVAANNSGVSSDSARQAQGDNLRSAGSRVKNQRQAGRLPYNRQVRSLGMCRYSDCPNWRLRA